MRTLSTTSMAHNSFKALIILMLVIPMSGFKNLQMHLPLEVVIRVNKRMFRLLVPRSRDDSTSSVGRGNHVHVLKPVKLAAKRAQLLFKRGLFREGLT